jgi:hypothetical protein
MEDKNKEFLSWALAEFKNEISIHEQRWAFFNPQIYFDYKIIININNFKYEGRGVNSSQSKAIAAALGECIERFALTYTSKNNSSGLALHSVLDIAKKNSQREILERHYVMLFTLGYCNEEVIQSSEIPQRVNILIERLRKNKISVKFYKLYSTIQETVILAEVSGLNSSMPFGLLFGASCKETLAEAIEASLREMLPNLMAFLNNNLHSIVEGEFIKIKNPKPEDHLYLYLDITFAKKYLHKRKFNSFHELIDTTLFASSLISYPFCNLYPVVLSSHPKCLEAKWGLLNEIVLPNLNPDFPFVLP